MDLQDFVASSLTQIIRAVSKAQSESRESGAWVSPAGIDLPKEVETIEVSPGVRAYVHDVEFDVAVTVSDKQGAEAGAKLQFRRKDWRQWHC